MMNCKRKYIIKKQQTVKITIPKIVKNDTIVFNSKIIFKIIERTVTLKITKKDNIVNKIDNLFLKT